ncbi:MAG: peptidase S8/S53 subtilisin kexin sedolisin, partial [Marivirga sp.]|nr:peptidase S8/S53 subtilisin kexin sedolisin [Marivirga sp.]
MVWSRLVLLSIFLCIAGTISAQVNRYMVFFKDKSGSSYSTALPLQFLSQRAVDRRVRQAIEVTSADLPVNENYITGLKDAGADIYFSTRWMNGVLVQCDNALVTALESLPYVDHVEFVAPNSKLM